MEKKDLIIILSVLVIGLLWSIIAYELKASTQITAEVPLTADNCYTTCMQKCK
jgi:hypothetical protein